MLLIIIGGAMVAFILGDIFSGRAGSVSNRYVGEVYGEEINMLDYERRVEEFKQSQSSVGQPVSGAAEQQIRNQVWNSMVQEKILYSEMNKLGMRLGQDEFDDVRFGENVRPEFANDENFKNPETGQFDAQLVQNYFAFLKERYPIFYQVQVNRIVNERLYEKYNNLVRKGVFTNTVEAKDEYIRSEQRLRLNFVVRPFETMADSLVQVSDKDLKAYFDKNKNQPRFEREAIADVAFVAWDVTPTAEDEEATRTEISNLIDDFQAAANDSLFVLKYSASRNTFAAPFNLQDQPEFENQVLNAAKGDVIGPYKSGDRWIIAKVDRLEDEEQATVRHILLSNAGGKSMDKLKQKADSIRRVIQSKKNFEDMVNRFSEDPGSVSKGGKYENFNREMMVPEFTAASFDKPIGSLQIVETTYGVHIVEPLARRTVPKVFVREVDVRIEPSNSTYNMAYDAANEFSLAAGSAARLRSLAEERGLSVQEGKGVGRQSLNLPGVANSLDAVRWAHNRDKTKVGKVSEPFEFGRKIVVVALERRTDDGRATFEDVKDEIRPEVVRAKKAELFKKEMTGKTMEQLVDEMALTMQLASGVTEKRPSLPGAGNEPYVVGYAMTLPEGTTSEPIEGNRGIFVVNVVSKTVPEPRSEYEVYRDELRDARRNQFSNVNLSVYKALKEFANVRDDRSKVY